MTPSTAPGDKPQSLLRSGSLFTFILITSWAVVQIALYWKYGIVTELEASKYIYEANRLLETGSVSTPNYWLYSVQIFLIAAAIKLNAGFFSVYLVQLFFNAFAIWAFYKFITSLTDQLTGLVMALLLLFNIPVQTYNCYLQTESLFYSFTIIFSCYLLTRMRLSLRVCIALIAFLLLICITRPTGLLFVPVSFLYLFFRFAKKLSTIWKVGITIAGTLLVLVLLNLALGSGGELDFMLPYRDERIICGVPTLSEFRDISVSDHPNSIYGLFYYVTHNISQFIRLAWLRSRAFFGLARSYYSTGHNLYLYLYFFPFYAFVIMGIRKWIKLNKYILLYCSMIILITWGTVILTCDDWHNRFFLSVVPYIYILSAPVVQTIANKFNPNARKVSIQERVV